MQDYKFKDRDPSKDTSEEPFVPTDACPVRLHAQLAGDPLRVGGTPAVISENIREMVKTGHPRKQAVAAALSNARYVRKH